MAATRRDILKTLALGGTAALITPALGDAPASAPADPKQNPLRFVHLTDMHVTAMRKGNDGFLAALKMATAIDPPPEFIVTGGDHVMDAFGQEREVVDRDWKLYREVLAAGNPKKLPVYPVMGNHDVWAWGIPKKVAANTPGWGKALPMEQLGMKTRYYAFDVGAWHFIVLDSIDRRQYRDGSVSFLGLLDDEQRTWFEKDLKSVKEGRHICVISHIPILSASVFFDGDRLQSDFWHVPDAWMHRDAAALVELLRVHKVKLAISGHIHLLDRVEYNGVHFVCNGAICGNYWRGPYHETPEGFGIFDMYPDGRFVHQYVDVKWKPQPE